MYHLVYNLNTAINKQTSQMPNNCNLPYFCRLYADRWEVDAPGVACSVEAAVGGRRGWRMSSDLDPNWSNRCVWRCVRFYGAMWMKCADDDTFDPCALFPLWRYIL